MIEVSDQIKQEIFEKTNSIHWSTISINGETYYVKPDNEQKEVIGYNLSKLFSLNSATYEGISINRKNYSISRDLSELYDFHLAEEFILDDYSLFDLLRILKEKSFYNIELEFDIIKMFVFDLLFLNDDRRLSNWGIANINGIARIVLLDYSNIFGTTNNPYIKCNPDLYHDNNSPSTIYKDLGFFLKYCPENYVEEVKRLIEQMDIDTIRKIIRSSLSEINEYNVSKYMRIYEEHYHKISDILNEIRGVQR